MPRGITESQRSRQVEVIPTKAVKDKVSRGLGRLVLATAPLSCVIHHISALGADCIRVMHGRAGAESGPRSASASVIRDTSEPSELVTSQNRLGTDVWRARQGGAPGLAGCREDKEVDE